MNIFKLLNREYRERRLDVLWNKKQGWRNRSFGKAMAGVMQREIGEYGEESLLYQDYAKFMGIG